MDITSTFHGKHSHIGTLAHIFADVFYGLSRISEFNVDVSFEYFGQNWLTGYHLSVLSTFDPFNLIYSVNPPFSGLVLR